MIRTVSSRAFRRIVWASMLACTVAVLSAQPALTTIHDILYRADGVRFTGTISIAWKPFVSGGSAFIPQQGLKLDVTNGVLRAKLVPTTNASAGANYDVTFSSQGRYLFSETWAVPPSLNSLRVKDVRVSSGTVVGNPPVYGQVSQISDVDGLDNELMLRPIRGFNFTLGRAAMINAAGQIDGVQGNSGDCVRVDGSASPCSDGASGVAGTVAFVDGEIPTGLVNNSNATFLLSSAPAPAASLLLYRNGLLMRQNLDFTLTAQTITFLTQSLPQSGDALVASYRISSSGSDGGSASANVTAGVGLVSSPSGVLSLDTATVPTFLQVSQSIDFGSIAGHTCADNTSIVFTGAQFGDAVIPRTPATLESNLVPVMFISAANVLKVRLCNETATAIDPINQPFGAVIVRSF